MWPLRSQPHETAKALAPKISPEILAIVGDVLDQATVAKFASSYGRHVTFAATLDEASVVSASPNTAVIVLDRDLADCDWRLAVRSLVQHQPVPCVILASSVLDDYLFDEVVKQGGFDIVAKPIRPDELRRIGGLALTFWNSRFAGSSSG